MNLIETLRIWDTNLFLALNGAHNSFFDGFMMAFSNKLVWIPFYISVLYVIIKQWKSESFWVILSFAVCILLADQISSGIIKNTVQRLRPSREETISGLVHLVDGYRGGKYGFVSGHAANSLSFAVLSAFLFRKKGYTLIILLWSLITGYSRIYLGVHYPLDVVGGYMVGFLVAIFCYWLLRTIKPNIFYVSSRFRSKRSANSAFPLLILLATVVGILGWSLVRILV